MAWWAILECWKGIQEDVHLNRSVCNTNAGRRQGNFVMQYLRVKELRDAVNTRVSWTHMTGVF